MSDAPAPVQFGSWEDAEALRRWSFLRRSPLQRLAWLVGALEIAYSTGALRAPARALEPAPVPTQPQPGLAR